MIYIVTFSNKLEPEAAKTLLNEIRKKLPPGACVVFSPRPPAGKKRIYTFNGVTVIVTTPHTPKPSSQSDKQGQFTLGEVWDKITHRP